MISTYGRVVKANFLNKFTSCIVGSNPTVWATIVGGAPQIYFAN